MIVLDTDVLSLLMRQAPAARTLIDRLESVPTAEVATTIISFEEHVRGWMSRIARSRSLADQVDSYRRLNQLLPADPRVESVMLHVSDGVTLVRKL